jgi:DNA-directed RNA polymerase specialized sigma24 family protein
MENHENCYHPGEDESRAFAESMAIWILAAAEALADDLDRQDTAIFILVSYLMRHLEDLREKLGRDPEAQRRYCFGALWNNRRQHNRAEATYAGPLYQIEEESWLDTVAENSPDHAGLVVEWVTLQQEMEGANLTPRQREVYILTKVYRMSRQEAADKLGIRKTRVQTLWHSAYRKIAEFRMKDLHVSET